MTAKVETCGRGRDTATYGQDDLEAFFQKSGRIEAERLDHTPFIVFRVIGDTVTVVLERNSYELVLNHPPDTKVMVQWPGQWRSDFFEMTVEDVRTAMIEKGMALPSLAGARCDTCGRYTYVEHIGERCEVCQGRISSIREVAPGQERAATVGRCTDCRTTTEAARIGQSCRRTGLPPHASASSTRCRGRIIAATGG